MPNGKEKVLKVVFYLAMLILAIVNTILLWFTNELLYVISEKLTKTTIAIDSLYELTFEAWNFFFNLLTSSGGAT